MFDPRMMAPDGSSYSRSNVLAAPQLAATSGMAPPTPTGVQTFNDPGRGLSGGANIHRFGQGGGGMSALAGLMPQMGDLWGQFQDWRGMRPDVQGMAPDMRRQQMQDWRMQRPSFNSIFRGF